MTKQSYRDLEAELEAVLDRVENHNYENLEDMLKDYELGKNIIQKLQAKLDTAKNSIKNIK